MKIFIFILLAVLSFESYSAELNLSSNEEYLKEKLISTPNKQEDTLLDIDDLKPRHQSSLISEEEKLFNLEKFLTVFGYVSAVLSAEPFAELAYDFGYRYGGIAGGVFIVPIAIAPILILGSKFMAYIFNEFGKKLCFSKTKGPKNSEERQSNDCTGSRIIGNSAAFLTGMISAVPLTYYTHKIWFPRISYGALLFDIPMFYVKTFSDVWSLNAITNVFFRYMPKITLTKDNKDIIVSEENPMFALNNLGGDDNMEEMRNSEQKSLIPTSQPKSQKNFYNNTFLLLTQLAGTIIGGVSIAYLEPMSMDGMNMILNKMKINNQTATAVLAYYATIAAGALTAYATADSFGKFYDFSVNTPAFIKNFWASEINIREIKWKDFLQSRGMIASYSAIISIFAAAPTVELSLKYLGNHDDFDRLILASAIISPFALDFWALDEFFLSLKNKPQNQ
ncbi:MAG: hypothetical protein K2X39_03265 [Silvanigrellaceae bacterium]|nr:hypothetical protein [Silvanigrellaceae bacterium]